MHAAYFHNHIIQWHLYSLEYIFMLSPIQIQQWKYDFFNKKKNEKKVSYNLSCYLRTWQLDAEKHTFCWSRWKALIKIFQIILSFIKLQLYDIKILYFVMKSNEIQEKIQNFRGLWLVTAMHVYVMSLGALNWVDLTSTAYILAASVWASWYRSMCQDLCLLRAQKRQKIDNPQLSSY